MKKIYFVQVGVSFSSPCFLPYSVGCIAAYLKKDEEIMRNYEIADILVMRERIPDMLKRFEEPAFVALSCATWNMEYNKVLAKELKTYYPDVKIVFGGPSVPKNTSLLEKYDFIIDAIDNVTANSSNTIFK